MSKMQVSKHECELCRSGIRAEIESIKAEGKNEREAIRREIRLSATIIISMTGVFVSVLGILLGVGVI